MLKFQMHVRVKYSALTFQTITPLSVRIATSQGDYFRDSTCMMLRYAWEFQMITPTIASS